VTSLDLIFTDALSVDGYSLFPNTIELANEVMSDWYAGKKLPTDSSLLKACLFVEIRRSRFIDGYPGESDMPYITALHAAAYGGEHE